MLLDEVILELRWKLEKGLAKDALKVLETAACLQLVGRPMANEATYKRERLPAQSTLEELCSIRIWRGSRNTMDTGHMLFES